MNISLMRGQALFLAALLALPSLSAAQLVDAEPNDSCAAAQDLGAPSRPFTIDGALSGAPGAPDIDFYRVTGTPGEPVQVNLRGSGSGAGTLESPLLGIFDGECFLLSATDNGFGSDPETVFLVPLTGTFVIAATAFPDYGFTGIDASGSYVVAVSDPATIDSISGRLVNATTGSPLSGNFPDFATVFLLRCTPQLGCNFVGNQLTAEDGTFTFNSDFSGLPLLAGEFQLTASANAFEDLPLSTFDVAAGEARNLGDLPMQPRRVIGNINARLLDAFDGSPLAGDVPPFAFALLERCDGEDCIPVVGASPDLQGFLTIDGALFQIPPGDFRLMAFAEDYQVATSDRFTLGEFQDIDVGDILLTPFPIQFGQSRGCDPVTSGSVCNFGIEVRNRAPGRFAGEAWVTVTYFPFEFPFRPYQFQVGRRGASDPRPERFKLREGETLDLRFALPLPAAVPVNSTLCASVIVGSGRQPQFNSQGDRFLFCVLTEPSGLTMLSGAEGRKHHKAMKERARN